jgi:hypothetical protein
MTRFAVLCTVLLTIGGAYGADSSPQPSGGVQTFPYIPRFCNWQMNTGQHTEQGALYTVQPLFASVCCGAGNSSLYAPGVTYYRQPEVLNFSSIRYVCIPVQEPQPNQLMKEKP